jgi:thiamine-phosphate pyrophosphorylase
MLIYVTNRHLCREQFLDRIEKLACGEPHAIILREKDLSPDQYAQLATEVRDLCLIHGVTLIINKHYDIAVKLGVTHVQLTLADFRQYHDRLNDLVIGVSVHSMSQAREAWTLGANYLIAGHIFQTDCKKDLPPRGLGFLEKICEAVPIPVMAIGGINTDSAGDVLRAEAKGICLMSEAMTTTHPSELTEYYKQALCK